MIRQTFRKAMTLIGLGALLGSHAPKAPKKTIFEMAMPKLDKHHAAPPPRMRRRGYGRTKMPAGHYAACERRARSVRLSRDQANAEKIKCSYCRHRNVPPALQRTRLLKGGKVQQPGIYCSLECARAARNEAAMATRGELPRRLAGLPSPTALPSTAVAVSN